MKVLITGSQGFIGRKVSEYISKKGHEVIGYDKRDGFDILEEEMLDKSISTVDIVIHMAAILGTDKTIINQELGDLAHSINIQGGLNILKSSFKHKVRLITLDNGNWWMANPYSASKHYINQLVRAYARHKGLNADIVRAFNVYGEGQSLEQNKFMPNFLSSIINDKPIQIYGSGNQMIDAIYVEDVAEIIGDVALNGSGKGNTYEAGTGLGMSVNAFVSLVKKILQKPNHPVEYLPMRPGEDLDSKVVANIPYKHLETDYEETIQKTYQYYLKQNNYYINQHV